MSKFRVPRKEKNTLKKTIWLYPPDTEGNSLMAFPRKNQADYLAYKKGMVRSIMQNSNRKEYWQQLNKPVTIADEQLREYVDDVFAERYRNTSYNKLIKAKSNPLLIKYYYNFINACILDQKGDESYGNTCCLAVDTISYRLKQHRRKKNSRGFQATPKIFRIRRTNNKPRFF